MKKLLLLVALLLSLCVVFVACADDGENETGTSAESASATEAITDAPTETPTEPAEIPTETPTEPATELVTDTATEPATELVTDTATEPATELVTDTATEPATEAPTEPLWEPVASNAMSADTYYEDGNAMKDGQAQAWLAENRADGIKGVNNILFRGWAGIGDKEIAAYGYSFDNDKNNVVWNADFIKPAEDAVKNAAGSQYATRYEILLDLSVVPETETHTLHVLVKATDGSIFELANWNAIEIKVTGTKLMPQDIGAMSPDTYFENGETLQEGSAHEWLANNRGGVVKDVQTAGFRGWAGIPGGNIESFGYTIDDGEYITDPAYTSVFDSEAHENAVKAAGGEFIYKIIIDLDTLDNKEHTLTLYAKGTDGRLYTLNKWGDIKVIGNQIAETSKTFKSDVASNEDGTDLRNSDLANFFNIIYGAGDPHKVEGGLYVFGSINELFANVDGKYVYSLDIASAEKAALAFVRGVHALQPVDASKVQFVINNYYETDGHDLMGGAGIYARISDGKLTLVLKAYDPNTGAGVANHTFEFVVDSTVLTFADDGKDTIYILAGDKLITKITLSGEVEYNDFFSLVDPAVKFAAKAEVVNADNEVVTIENTLIASTPSQVGVAVRPNLIKFSSIEVAQFSSITIPEEYYRAEAEAPADGIYSINDAISQSTHISNDEIVATVDGTSVNLKAWGWIGLTAEFESFGYKIDDGEVVLSTDWIHEAEDAVKNAAAGTGATVSTRFNVITTVDGIAAGDHTVKYIYKLADGTLICFATATFTIADAEA